VLLAVLPSPCESQVHGPRSYAETHARKEGRSSLHAFPPHRPLIRLAFFRQNRKIRGPVGKVGLIAAGANPVGPCSEIYRTLAPEPSVRRQCRHCIAGRLCRGCIKNRSLDKEISFDDERSLLSRTSFKWNWWDNRDRPSLRRSSL
jgi:hypothetical protein